MTAETKAYEQRLADLVRLLGSESEGEVLATHGALKRHLASRSVGFTDLGNAIEKLATGGLERPNWNASTTPAARKAYPRPDASKPRSCRLRPASRRIVRLAGDRALLPTREDSPSRRPENARS